MTNELSESTMTSRPTVLVAEDDGPSGQFFKAVLEGFGIRVILESDGKSALAQARKHHFDLLLLDCRMPGAGAVQIFSTLRSEPDAASHATPAIATSAEMDTAQRRLLQQIGFAGMTSKPITLAALKALVQPLLSDSAASPLLDDQAALEQSGTPDAVAALRGLFAHELRQLANELEPLAERQPAELSERLHRLLASCGFCGAHALTDVSRHLKKHLDHGGPPCPAEIERFRQTLTHTLQALDEQAKALP